MILTGGPVRVPESVTELVTVDSAGERRQWVPADLADEYPLLVGDLFLRLLTRP